MQIDSLQDFCRFRHIVQAETGDRFLLAGSYDRVKRLVADFVRGRPEAEQSRILGEAGGRFYGLKVRHGLTTQR